MVRTRKRNLESEEERKAKRRRELEALATSDAYLFEGVEKDLFEKTNADILVDNLPGVTPSGCKSKVGQKEMEELDIVMGTIFPFKTFTGRWEELSEEEKNFCVDQNGDRFTTIRDQASVLKYANHGEHAHFKPCKDGFKLIRWPEKGKLIRAFYGMSFFVQAAFHPTRMVSSNVRSIVRGADDAFTTIQKYFSTHKNSIEGSLECNKLMEIQGLYTRLQKWCLTNGIEILVKKVKTAKQLLKTIGNQRKKARPPLCIINIYADPRSVDLTIEVKAYSERMKKEDCNESCGKLSHDQLCVEKTLYKRWVLSIDS